MDFNNLSKINSPQFAMGNDAIARAQSNFMSKVFSWMSGGLLLTGTTAWFTYDSGLTSELSGMMLFLFLPLLGLVWFLSSRIETMSPTTAITSFLIYSAANGLVLSTVFVVYASDSISNIFMVTAVSFAGLALYGYTTKKSLSGVGNFMYMGLIGIVFASIVNIFVGSSMLMLTISILAVLIFSGLTAYDTQRIKEMYLENAGNPDMESKIAIIGALSLYLNFINLFLALLRIFGNRD